MSRRRSNNRSKKEELNKEYKDPNITNKKDDQAEFKITEEPVVIDDVQTEKTLPRMVLEEATKFLLDNKDEEILDYIDNKIKSNSKNSIYGTTKEDNKENEYQTIKVKYPSFIKSSKNILSRNLLVGELDEKDRKYFINSPGYAMAFIHPDTLIEAIDEGDGWIKLHKGYIYNEHISKNKDAETLLSKDRYLSRMNDINKFMK